MAETEAEETAEQRRASHQTVEEPEREKTNESGSGQEKREEEMSHSSGDPAPSIEDIEPIVPDHRPTAEQAAATGYEEQVQRSREMSNRLGGLPQASVVREWRMRRQDTSGGRMPSRLRSTTGEEEDSEKVPRQLAIRRRRR